MSKNDYSSKYPKTRAVRIGKSLLAKLSSQGRRILEQSVYHDLQFFFQLCGELGIRLVTNKLVPGRSGKGLIMDVHGTTFIVLDNELRKRPEESLYVLAHEVSHYLLGHVDTSDSVCPYSYIHGYPTPMDENDEWMQRAYFTDLELEADLLSWFLIAPDNLLLSVIRDEVFIPAKKTAGIYGLRWEWMAARIQLFRKMHGYEQSRKLLRERLKNPMALTNVEAKWCSTELRDDDCLAQFMPEVDPKILPYLD